MSYLTGGQKDPEDGSGGVSAELVGRIGAVSGMTFRINSRKRRSLDHRDTVRLCADGVRVNAIGLRLIETPLNARVRAGNPKLVKIFLDHTPLGRTGKPGDIVGRAIFLTSERYVGGAPDVIH
jgi:hypothetical protein